MGQRPCCIVTDSPTVAGDHCQRSHAAFYFFGDYYDPMRPSVPNGLGQISIVADCSPFPVSYDKVQLQGCRIHLGMNFRGRLL